MNTQELMDLMEQDFKLLASERERKANELRRIGKNLSATALSLLEQEAEGHLLLARMYRRMVDDTLAFIETYDDGREGDNGN